MLPVDLLVKTLDVIKLHIFDHDSSTPPSPSTPIMTLARPTDSPFSSVQLHSTVVALVVDVPSPMQESAPTGDKSIVYKYQLAPGKSFFYFKYAGKFYAIRADHVEGELKLVVTKLDKDPEKTAAQQYLWCTGNQTLQEIKLYRYYHVRLVIDVYI